MRIAVVTLFPELFEPFLSTSLVGRARDGGAIDVHLEPLRPHGHGRHLSVDDTPYGGGSGMVMRPDCVVAAIEAASKHFGDAPPWRVLLTPQGERFSQSTARALVSRGNLLMVCGRYEGFDERIRSFVDQELSIGDFVLTGGEIPAMTVIEACIRLLPGVLGNENSPAEESFSDVCGGMLEYPQYTRPLSFRGLEVPELLRSGDHEKIRLWRQEQTRQRTRERRPDLGEGAFPPKGRKP
jgi:tRNA (guanine37-N1)-methyltransferase